LPVRGVLVALGAITAALCIYRSAFFGADGDPLTAGWSALGAGLMVVGIASGQAIYRRTGLAILALCLGRIFAVDTRHLAGGTRVLTYLLLGVCLIAIYWLYARANERVKGWS
jgi:uncharacterized membrane protein